MSTAFALKRTGVVFHHWTNTNAAPNMVCFVVRKYSLSFNNNNKCSQESDCSCVASNVGVSKCLSIYNDDCGYVRGIHILYVSAKVK